MKDTNTHINKTLKTMTTTKEKFNYEIEKGTLAELFDGWVLEELYINSGENILTDWSYDEEPGKVHIIELKETRDNTISDGSFIDEKTKNPVIIAGEPFEITDADPEKDWNNPELIHYCLYEYLGDGKFQPAMGFEELSFLTKNEAQQKLEEI